MSDPKVLGGLKQGDDFDPVHPGEGTLDNQQDFKSATGVDHDADDLK